MNEILRNLLLAEEKFMTRMHLRQAGFTYSALLKTKNVY